MTKGDALHPKMPSGRCRACAPCKKECDSGASSETASNAESAEFDEFDSSDEEDLRNTIGNIPVKWYDEYKHIGYDLSGKPIAKAAQKSEIDAFLARMDDPKFWRTVNDVQTGGEVVLSDEQVATISNVSGGRYPTSTFNLYQPFLDLYSHEVMKHPVTNHPEHKRSFIPSKLEKEKVGKLVHAIKMGWIKPRKPKALEDEEPKYYDIWAADDEDNKSQSQLARLKMHIPAPKVKLPGHAESYNPPPEYLFTPEEQEKWRSQESYERQIDFVPQKFASLRYVPGYDNFVKERFERCLDLYLAPRQRKMKLNMDPNDLLPKLPKPQELQPFPTVQAIVYVGHSDVVRSLTVEPIGQFIASGSDDKSVRIWEVGSGRCFKTVVLPAEINCVAWCPSRSLSLLAVAAGNVLYLINHGVGDKLIVSDTDRLLSAMAKTANTSEVNEAARWSALDATSQLGKEGIRLTVQHKYEVKSVAWHEKGDYFATVCPAGGATSVLVHQLTKWKSQCPFSRSKGNVQRVLFHPSRPIFFVATERAIRVYNLAKQELTKKLLGSVNHISSIALHRSGDHILAGSFDARTSWFDMDLSVRPYKTLRHQKQAIRNVAFHQRYPLFASCSDDGTTVVCHGMVYNDLMQNPLIVPVKILRGHKKEKDLYILDCLFHPTQPWIFTCGADATIRLFT